MENPDGKSGEDSESDKELFPMAEEELKGSSENEDDDYLSDNRI